MLVGVSTKRIRKVEADIKLLMEDRKTHQKQIENLIRLFQEYTTELDRRKTSYKILMRKAGMVMSFIAGVSLPLYI
jgi:hypothetical protein